MTETMITACNRSNCLSCRIFGRRLSHRTEAQWVVGKVSKRKSLGCRGRFIGILLLRPHVSAYRLWFHAWPGTEELQKRIAELEASAMGFHSPGYISPAIVGVPEPVDR